MRQAEVVVGAGQADLLFQSHLCLGKSQDLAGQRRDVCTQGQVDRSMKAVLILCPALLKMAVIVPAQPKTTRWVTSTTRPLTRRLTTWA